MLLWFVTRGSRHERLVSDVPLFYLMIHSKHIDDEDQEA